jgi:hypothetical protein
VIVLEAVPEDQEILVAWNDLVFRMERPEVFFTHQWALAASRAFSASLFPKIFLMYEAGQLAGIAAMATTLKSPGTAFFLTASTADYCDIVSAPEIRPAILTALLEQMKDMGVRDLVLANVPAESSTLRALAASARSQGFHIHDRPGYDCGIISLGDAAQRQDVLRSVCLLRLSTEEACADPSVKKVDLGLGDEPYKARFCNSVSSTRYVQLSRSVSGHLAAVGRHRLVSNISSFPVLESHLRRTRLVGRQRRILKMSMATVVRRLLTRARSKIISKKELAFFEAPQMTVQESERASLNPICWENLALAAMHNSDDERTLEYLARSGRRLRTGETDGYCLQAQEIQASHFLWVAPYDGFHSSELDSTLESSDSNAVILFDCFTPTTLRKCGHYSTAIRLAAAALQKQQRHVWIFSAIDNNRSLNGIVKAGFVYRFSLARNRWFGNATFSRHPREFLTRALET